MLEEVEADHGRYLARSVSAVESVRLTEVRLTADQWQEVGQVQSLYIYPIKSMAGVRVDTFNVEKTGPR